MLRDFGRVETLWLKLVLNTGALGEFRDLVGSGTLVELTNFSKNKWENLVEFEEFG